MLDSIAHIQFSGNLVILLILAVFAVLLIYETLYPRDKHPRSNLKQSYKTNIGMFVVNTALLSALSASSLLLMIDPNIQRGVFDFITNHPTKVIISFLTLDLLLYYWHKTCHRYDWLWMFHRVHHNDSHINVSTAFRVHFIELFLTNLLKVGVVILTGIDELVLLWHEVITTMFVMFHHTNIKVRYESVISKIFIGPALHRTHHAIKREEHDSNYGAIFSFWDKIFGTLLHIKSTDLGIAGYSPQTLLKLISFGFITPVEPIKIPEDVLTNMIREAAYYRALHRGFAPGNDQGDWYAAQQDIHRTLYNDAIKPKSKYGLRQIKQDNLIPC